VDDNGNVNLVYNNEIYFQMDKINHLLWVRYKTVYLIFHNEFKMFSHDIDKLITNTLLDNFRLVIPDIQQIFIEGTEDYIIENYSWLGKINSISTASWNKSTVLF
jgi:hypothetical protein